MIIALLNKSSRYAANPEILVDIASAVTEQLAMHVAPAWGMVPWSCVYFNDEKNMPTGAFRLWILDDADHANALGYHGQDPEGMPYGRVFANTIIKNGGTDFIGPNSISSIISHEACEIMVDPEVNAWRRMTDGRLACQEICDAVEGDSYPITVNNNKIHVSNFLFPAWFDTRPPAGSKFDYLNKLKAPFTMANNGYMIVMDRGVVGNLYGSKLAQEKYENNTSKVHEAARSFRRRQDCENTYSEINVVESKSEIKIKKPRKSRKAK